MKFAIVIAALLGLSFADQCPHDLQVKCQDDINKAFPICQKAAKEKGADVPADIECMKYLIQSE